MAADMERLAETLGFRLPLVDSERDRDGGRERCMRFGSPPGSEWKAELVVRSSFVRLNLAEPPSPEVLALADLEEKPSTDKRWVWAAEVTSGEALGARLLLEVACGVI
jgi:hypothetical protein